jgi:hypothetical protein
VGPFFALQVQDWVIIVPTMGLHKQTGNAGKTGAPLLLSAAILVCLLVYLPGLDGEFMFDDHWNLLQNPAVQIDELSPGALVEAAGSGSAGPLKRPISMLSFALDYYVYGFDAYFFKLTNLIVHLICGILVYAVVQRLLRNEANARLIAAVVSALWLVHPINLSSVLYVVQRMTLLASFFMLAGLLCYLVGRERLERDDGGKVLMVVALCVFTPLAALCKEIGLLLPLWFLLVEYTLYQSKTPATARFGERYFLVAVYVPAALLGAYLLINPDFILGAYHWRPFTIGERLMTEARVLWMYAGLVAVPGLARLGLFHDDFVLSSGLFTPPTTVFAIIGWVGLVALVLWYRRDWPLVCFGVLFFLSGHMLESSVIALDIAFEHRNYLPQLGLTLAAVFLLFQVPGIRGRWGVFLFLLVFLWFSALTLLRADNWSSPEQLSVAQLQHHPRSPRANYQVGRMYAQLLGAAKTDQQKAEFFQNALRHFAAASELEPGFKDGLFGILVLYSSTTPY